MGAARGTEDFASFLRELKERSGHSYGTLARRLHTSTSTLHRYCNGRAVPAQYAPVERLARLCGATPEELLELHRRWMRADALRGRGAERPGPAAETASGARFESEPESEPEPASPAAAVPRRSRVPPRPLPAVIAVLAVLLVAAVAAATYALPDRAGPQRRTAGGPTAPVPGADGGSGASPPSSGPSSASPSAPPSSPSPAGDGGNAQGGAEPGRTPRTASSRLPDGGDRERGRGGAPGAAPLSWSARSHVWRHGCDHRYLIDLPPSRVPPPPVEQDAAGWARSLGAVHGGETIVEATVYGTGAAPVVIETLHVRVTARRTPPARSVFAMNDGCGGSLTPAAFSVDLDAPRPRAKPVDGYDGEGGRPLPADRLPYRVTADDPLALRVEARTEGCDCDWYIEVEWSSGDDSGTLRVDDGGRPFRTGAVEGRPEYRWAPGTGTWERG
ncbi:helix-turn-helix domain-containing protein [Streptomyces sp. KL2]|uniref:helix-turn-helix domain-containing protein n=1 Tax=Streptomyces sp. KL2 TaxID=3050126 RepID=UPI00397B4288